MQKLKLKNILCDINNLNIYVIYEKNTIFYIAVLITNILLF